ncbi:ATP-binding protein [Planosporangium sp. 12N6]|uniref:ATP-binding protein n=1 Tax=Planosporangium spinosum TaxID=3402278 RepID=UPI003CEAB3D2
MSTQAAEAARTWCVVVPHHADGARLARRRLAASLAGWLPAVMLADAIAVTAELVGNAVRHAAPLPGGVVRVAWRLQPGGDIEIRVTDGGAATRPVERRVGSDSPDGRGLAIVAALTDRWGVDRDGLGQCVWARMAASVSPPAGAEPAGASGEPTWVRAVPPGRA